MNLNINNSDSTRDAEFANDRLADCELENVAGGSLLGEMLKPGMNQLRVIAIKKVIKAVENFPVPKKD